MHADPEHRLVAAFAAHARAPLDPAALLDICHALIGVQRDEQMLAWAEKGLALAPGHAGFVHARARALRLLGEHARAAQTWIDAAQTSWSPLFYEARLGRDLYLSGETHQAIAILERAVNSALPDDNPDKLRARKWLAEALLSLGDARGFTHWLYRNQGDSGNTRHADVPMWNGQRDLRGERVLVTHQMGYGDQFMLYGALRHWRDAGAEIMVTCDAPIHSVLEASLPDCRVVAARRPLAVCAPIEASLLPDVHDFAPTLQATLLHLPLLTAHDTPRPDPYFPAYIRAPESARENGAAWSQAMRAQHRGKLLVGVFWDCAQRHSQTLRSKERNWARLRSMPLDALERLTTNPALGERVQFVSLLHPGVEMHGGTPRGHFSHYAPAIGTFADTTACIEQLDAVVSVDAGVANLAAMTGKPTAVLVNPTGEWRWGKDGTHSPWIRDAHVLRQQTMGDWSNVIAATLDWLMHR
ncbi:hypothetical protein [Paraburkholderia sp. Ac-20347]|uniref:tetratricopeptide repeat protein n=1 Tax=Paraburkholderia sp. Ac-20347 TaxID=2703892 RepID=UPI00198105C0|nr:hypothetical protein [Paraburkholderia sp. Ac-20347]MBN3809730.1 glycosyltransferase family 9 protein [Paraburkholderia sp. Ac-20347]